MTHLSGGRDADQNWVMIKDDGDARTHVNGGKELGWAGTEGFTPFVIC